MMTVVVDTNVLLVANRQHESASEDCIVSCARRLEAIQKGGRVAIDDGYLILREYQNKTTPRAAKGPGDVFLKWLLQNQANTERCDQIPLLKHPKRGFESFPNDTRLARFDPSDRKFVAVASAHAHRPPVVQAADSKWLAWQAALMDHGVSVEFLCPADIRRFDDQKKARRRSR